MNANGGQKPLLHVRSGDVGRLAGRSTENEIEDTFVRKYIRAAVAIATVVFGLNLVPGLPSGRSAAQTASKRKGARYALLIGVNDYQQLDSLQFCRQDMVDLARRLVLAGFPEDHIYLLQDKADENRNRPFRSNIEEQLKLVSGLADSRDDVVVVAFSGHGSHIEGKSYLCPTDARDGEPDTQISLDAVYERLEQCPAAFKLVLVDACREYSLRGGRKNSQSTKAAMDKFAEQVEHPPEGLVVLNSCKSGQKSLEDKDLGHGIFTHFVLEGLAGKADANGDQIVSLGELYEYVGDATKTRTARKFGELQTPRFRGEVSPEALKFDFAHLLGPVDKPSTAISTEVPLAPPDAKPGDVVTNSIHMKLALIPAGEFLMGAQKKRRAAPRLRSNIGFGLPSLFTWACTK